MGDKQQGKKTKSIRKTIKIITTKSRLPKRFKSIQYR